MKKKYSRKKLKEMIDSYIQSDGVKSIAGLALFLGIDRDALMKISDTCGDIISYARTCIEKDIVENGLRGRYNASMASFILKSSFGYRDKGDETNREPVKVEVSDDLLEYAN